MKILCLLEDDPETPISQLYLKAFESEDITATIEYSKGNGGLFNKAKYFIEKLNYDLVVAFMDMIPGNKNIGRLYTDLLQLSRKKDFKIIVIPIISSEFLFIKSLQELSEHTGKMFLNRDNDTYGLIDRLLNKQPFYDIKEVREDSKFNENFKTIEKLSKYILKKYVIECAEHNKKHKSRAIYNKYYNSECPCEYYTEVCKGIRGVSIKEKAQRLVYQFPCYPATKTSKHILSVDDIWKIHRNGIDEFNRLNKDFREFERKIAEASNCSNLDISRYSEEELEYIK